MSIELHALKPQPGPDWCKCGWCHGGGYGGEKEPECRGCAGVGWWQLASLAGDDAVKGPCDPTPAA